MARAQSSTSSRSSAACSRSPTATSASTAFGFRSVHGSRQRPSRRHPAAGRRYSTAVAAFPSDSSRKPRSPSALTRSKPSPISTQQMAPARAASTLPRCASTRALQWTASGETSSNPSSSKSSAHSDAWNAARGQSPSRDRSWVRWWHTKPTAGYAPWARPSSRARSSSMRASSKRSSRIRTEPSVAPGFSKCGTRGSIRPPVASARASARSSRPGVICPAITSARTRLTSAITVVSSSPARIS